MKYIPIIALFFSILGYGNKINFYDEAFESFESGKEMVKYYKKTKECNTTSFDLNSFLETNPFKDFKNWYRGSFWVIAEQTAPSNQEQILNLVCAGADIPGYWVEGAIDRAYENFLNKSSEKFSICNWAQSNRALMSCRR